NGDGRPEDAHDLDLDNRPNHLDPDDDEDGIATRQEVADRRALGRESDSDSVPAWHDLDSDDDGLSDRDDGGGADLNGNGIPEYLEPRELPMPDAGVVGQDAGTL